MIEASYQIHRNEILLKGLNAFIHADEIGLVLYESDNMGNPNAKLIKATKLLLAMTCPDLLKEIPMDFVPEIGSDLRNDASNLCGSEEGCLEMVEKVIFKTSGALSSVRH